MSVALTPEQVHALKHALGWEAKRAGYRNYYSSDAADPIPCSLVDAGMMRARKAPSWSGDNTTFHVTRAGLEWLLAVEPHMRRKPEIRKMMERMDAT